MTEITDDLPARLLHEEHEAWQAILAGHGGSYYRRTMTRDALMIVPGAIIGRDKVAAAFDGAAPLDSYEIHEPAVIRLGEHAGIVVYRAVARSGDEVAELNMSTTYVFDDDNGGWCVAAHQQTPA
ncbi:MAG TPA: DUF4440 domain-containing protein [Cryobacterium sp.]|nr:DUF4440 domain-containing protein [Cryobacterium sp.]